MKKVAVIGTINRDTIHSADGSSTKSYGGVLYTVLALSSLLGVRGRIYPIVNIGFDTYAKVISFLKPLKNVLLDGLYKVDCLNNHVTINYSSSGEKEEVLVGQVSEIIEDQLTPAESSDIVCFNFISGFELSLDTYQVFCSQRKGPLFIDYHSLTLGISRGGKRFLRRPENWKEWIRPATVIQMNLVEASCLAGCTITNRKFLMDFAQDVLSFGPQALVITLGPDGCVLLGNDDEARIYLKHIPAPSVEAIDQTGCGDVFMAGFVTEYLQSTNVESACRFAVRAASANCLIKGIEQVHTISKLLENLQEESLVGSNNTLDILH